MFVIVSYCLHLNENKPRSVIVSGPFQTEFDAKQMCRKLISSFTGSDVEYAENNSWIISYKNSSHEFKFVYQVSEIQQIK